MENGGDVLFRQICSTMPTPRKWVQWWGVSFLGKTLRRGSVYGMTPKWSFLLKKSGYVSCPVAPSDSSISLPRMLVKKVVFEWKETRERVLLTISFFFTTP